MFVFLNNDSLNKKIFINKMHKREAIHLVFDKDNPVHEVEDPELAKDIVSSFPFYLNSSKEAPKVAESKPVVEEIKVEEVQEVSEPESITSESESEQAEAEVDEYTLENVAEEDTEENKEHKRGRRKKNN